MATKILLTVVSVLVMAYLSGLVVISVKFGAEVQKMYAMQKKT
jgi:hypothetical protein